MTPLAKFGLAMALVWQTVIITSAVLHPERIDIVATFLFILSLATFVIAGCRTKKG